MRVWGSLWEVTKMKHLSEGLMLGTFYIYIVRLDGEGEDINKITMFANDEKVLDLNLCTFRRAKIVMLLADELLGR
ncbi:MAG: hypothetical protein QKV96_gp41 [Methanophagales virus GBV303]|uniref:Uncharacterized protein n=1 Tax=Methanophagales virus GBV303 TaxID=2986514 RepID=A0A9E8V8F6_9VIRU|nr:MAG: hypothetical protein QKV96_gp41 [Methanophagales virus GBV303]WAE39677.1 MAG: hypothetical protein NNKAGPMP_00041 [Methanophagales virus GBV303]